MTEDERKKLEEELLKLKWYLNDAIVRNDKVMILKLEELIDQMISLLIQNDS